MTHNDFLKGLFATHPLLVAGVVLVTGWGSLLLIAWQSDAITNVLIKSPGFMIGDLILLPFAGLLITKFYQQIIDPTASVTSKRVPYAALILATLATIGATVYSMLVSGNYHGLWSVPHTIFIWFMAYIMIVFLFKGLVYLSSHPARYLWFNYLGVIAAVSVHIMLKLLTDSNSFPV